MDFDDTPDQARLRAKVRKFLADHDSELAHSDGPQLEERSDGLRAGVAPGPKRVPGQARSPSTCYLVR